MDRRAKDAFQTDRKRKVKRNSRLPVTFAAQLCYR